MGFEAIAKSMVRPMSARAFKALQKMGRELTSGTKSVMIQFNETIENMGIPPYNQALN
jgi:hypothetical protein